MSQLPNEYRIPTLDEFVKGFEYEVDSDGLSDDSFEDFCGYYRYKFQEGACFRDLDDIERELNQGSIRAKIKNNEA